ncbi:hypothetical protein DFH06DRAFT_1213242 [Mycena polygramma]|nr:hypothetical protein DFH06DRAFT_1213242 [Mycena polygramma]
MGISTRIWAPTRNPLGNPSNTCPSSGLALQVPPWVRRTLQVRLRLPWQRTMLLDLTLRLQPGCLNGSRKTIPEMSRSHSPLPRPRLQYRHFPRPISSSSHSPFTHMHRRTIDRDILSLPNHMSLLQPVVPGRTDVFPPARLRSTASCPHRPSSHSTLTHSQNGRTHT